MTNWLFYYFTSCRTCLQHFTRAHAGFTRAQPRVGHTESSWNVSVRLLKNSRKFVQAAQKQCEAVLDTDAGITKNKCSVVYVQTNIVA